MAKRPPLKSNVAKPTDHSAAASEAAKVAEALTRKTAPAAHTDDAAEMETVSYFLPLELVELCRDLAEARVKRDRIERREIVRQRKAALKAGQGVPPEPPAPARRSASAIVREALEAHRAAIEAEIKELE